MIKIAEKTALLREWYERWRFRHLRKYDTEGWDQLIGELAKILTPLETGNAEIMDIAMRYLYELERRAE